MEKRKRWQLFLIVGVMILTVYNILPTVFYYTKPLKSPINQERATTVGKQALLRVNTLEKKALDYLSSYNRLLGLKPERVELDQDNPQLIHLTYASLDDANIMRRHLPRAGALIPFTPAKLDVAQASGKIITVKRNIPLHFNPDESASFFSFVEKFDAEHRPTEAYKALVNDRLLELCLSLGGSTENATFATAALYGQNTDDFLLFLAQNINTYTDLFKGHPKIQQRFFATFTQSVERPSMDELLSAMDGLRDKVKLERIALEDEAKSLKHDNKFLESLKQERLEFLQNREAKLTKATATLRTNKTAFAAGASPWTAEKLQNQTTDTFTLGANNPLFAACAVDYPSDTIHLTLHRDIADLRENTKDRYVQEMLDNLLFSEVARLARESGERIVPMKGNFQIALSTLPGSSSLLVLNLPKIAEKKAAQIAHLLQTQFHPTHPDLTLPVWDAQTYASLPNSQKKLGLLVYTPTTSQGLFSGLKNNSVYVVAKGMEQIIQKVNAHPNSPDSEQFMQDFNQLRELLQKNGFIGYPGKAFHLDSGLNHDFVFEQEDYYSDLLAATREQFNVHGTKRFATLEFSNVEQRILTQNRIDDAIHEDLLKWRDEYNLAQVNMQSHTRFDVPKPTQSPFLSNMRLSFVKYFRGDERKILHWGLDLNGGKTVQIELRDQNNRIVKSEADLKQGINELFNRVNKMGVSEVAIRQEGSNIVLDFPGKQNLSAADLVKASSMYFHIVNEKFSPQNQELASATNQFLQEIWNEAVVTGRKDAESLNQIAWRHLYGDATDYGTMEPVSDLAKTLHTAGLRLASPSDQMTSSAFNDQLSKIALYRGESFTEWHGQTHPLLIVFRNYALEGSNLENVHAAYDASKGNFLSFQVAGSQVSSDGSHINPRAELHTWTNTFAKDSVQGTPLGNLSHERGWRMAVILNGTVISAPTLDSALEHSAMISGSFTQREVNRLEADLKAGSLTFAPHILSEKNVSPELGLKDRTKGIAATIVALIAVIALMCSYYRFAGVVASVAVLFNLLIMWATLQNIQATMTLAGIAAIILTVGMAVDANVLVFERIREEFKASGRLASAVRAGYSKAFSAIIDSNVTTIIAALILLNFDSGPIKGFAVTLIIGIVSSMFTALFMTRFFFAGWVQNPAHKELKMANFVKGTNFNFLRFGKLALGASLVVMLVGGYTAVATKNTFLGMDFTGGFSLTVDLESKTPVNYREAVEKALTSAGISSQDIQVREQNPESNVKIMLSTHLEDAGQPFHAMPLETQGTDNYPYENNPRIAYVVQALQAAGLSVANPETVDQNWTNVSGQMSDSMRNNALIGLSLALLCILIYIAFRFEFKYAFAATLGLGFDVLFTVGLLALLHLIGVPAQIDLKTIAALMTIIGYSLNDTIIIFDRIREDLRLMKNRSLWDVINHALNVTLSRTIMTSGTTLIVLLALIALGGSTIFGLSLVMIIGVVYGTFSSLFVAAPLLVWMHREQEVRTEKKLALNT